ncbi:hypothetical protein AAHA92_07852 [Salvia divinorum]|uniref:Uncharacterized protein n=1 Tax=Salvia divinorum TaxID=28513 RepID=A0ABD1HLC3_SALDI
MPPHESSRSVSLTTSGMYFGAAGGMLVLPSLYASDPPRSEHPKTTAAGFVALGLLALGRAGFAVNHMDVAPGYAGIVMGVSNTAGTLAGIVGVDLTGRLLEAAKAAQLDLTSPENWREVFLILGLLCIFSSIVLCIINRGENFLLRCVEVPI